jgi:hypothetical protein
MIDLLNPNKRIDPEAFKSLLQDDDDTPIGRLNGLAGEPAKFQNDGVYISMDLNEPNFDTIYTSTYMGIIDSLDSQNVNRLGASRLDYRAKSKNESIYGLMGELGPPGKLEHSYLQILLTAPPPTIQRMQALTCLTLSHSRTQSKSKSIACTHT